MSNTLSTVSVPSVTLRAYLLGAFRLERAGQAVALPRFTRARELLAYLLLHHAQPQPRAVLAGLFWPECSEEQARHSLSTALWRINQALPDVVIASNTLIHIKGEVWTDVQAFTELVTPYLATETVPAAARVSLQQAIDLYSGDLLDGVYAEWTNAPREQLRGQYHHALEQLILLEKSEGHYERALGLAVRLCCSDPLRESAHREVMRLHLALDRPQSALRQYEVCCQVLREEVGAEPEAETTALAQTIAEIARRAGVDVSPYIPQHAPRVEDLPLFVQERPGHLPLIGRDAERAQLLTHLEALWQTPRPRNNLILIEGEAGVGKTRLVQELARDAQWRGAHVLWGRGRELEAVRPCALLVEALESGLTSLRARQLAQVVAPVWLQVLGRLSPRLTEYLPALGAPPPIEPEQESVRLVESFVQVLNGWTQIAPVVLILEDLHWIDPDTLAIGPHLARRVQGLRLLVVGTYRGAEARAQPAVWAGLQALDRAVAHERMALARLDAASTGELIRRSLGLRKPAELFEARVYWETRGNPLFVLEVLRTLYAKGLLYRDADGDWSTPYDDTTQDYGELNLPQAIDASITRRLQRLPAEARLVLQAAAVLGAEVDLAALQSVCGLDMPALLEALCILGREEILVETAQTYQFSHDKFRQLAYQEINHAERVAFHRRAGVALEAQAAPVEILAQHFTQGQVWDKAVTYTLRAAQQAQAAYANEKAIASYTQVLALGERQETSDGWESQLAARCGLGEVLARLGRYDEALAYLEQACQQLEADQPAAQRNTRLAQVCAQIAQVHDLRGEFGLAHAYLARAHQALAAGVVSSGEAGWLCFLSGKVCYHERNLADAEQWLHQALTLARSNADRTLEADTWRLLGAVCWARGDYHEMQTMTRICLDIYRAIGDRLGETLSQVNLGLVCFELGRYAESIAYYEQPLLFLRQVGDRHTEALVLINLGSAYLGLGDLSHAVTDFTQALSLYQEMNITAFVNWALDELGNVMTLLGDYAAAAQYYAQALQSRRELGDRHGQGETLGDMGRLACLQGDYAAAVHYCQQAIAILQEHADRASMAQAWGYLGRAWLGLGELDAAWAACQQAVAIRQELGNVALLIEAQAGLAAVRLAQGETASAYDIACEICAYLEQQPLVGPDDPEWVYLICYQVLQANCDSRATMLLETAYARLHERAARIADPAARQLFLDNVAAHRELCAAYAQWQARRRAGQRTVQLPRADAPRGGALRPEQMISVTWTLEAPGDQAIADKGARRRQQLLRLVAEAQAQGALPAISDLADALQVTPMTIKRDLAALRQAGYTVRTRGQR